MFNPKSINEGKTKDFPNICQNSLKHSIEHSKSFVNIWSDLVDGVIICISEYKYRNFRSAFYKIDVQSSRQYRQRKGVLKPKKERD